MQSFDSSILCHPPLPKPYQAASPPLARFAAALPSVRTLLDTCHPVTDVGPTAHHRLVWQLVMGRHLAAPPGGHVADAEEAMACLLESVGSTARGRPLDVEAMAVRRDEQL